VSPSDGNESNGQEGAGDCDRLTHVLSPVVGEKHGEQYSFAWVIAVPAETRQNGTAFTVIAASG